MGRSNTAGAKVGCQELIATEHVQRQEAVVAIEAVEMFLSLVAMSLIIGGIVIENDLLGRALVTVEKRVDDGLVDLEDDFRGDSVFKSAMSRRACQGEQFIVVLILRGSSASGDLKRRVVSKLVVIVGVLVSCSDTEDTAGEELALRMGGTQRDCGDQGCTH